jgi:hypothetical protein
MRTLRHCPQLPSHGNPLQFNMAAVRMLIDCDSKSWDSPVGIEPGYGAGRPGQEAFLYSTASRRGSVAHPATHPMGTRVSLPGGKAGGF